MEYLVGEKEQVGIGWMREAAKVAEQALCHNAKCGAVIVRDGKVIGRGYNAPPLDSEHNRTCDSNVGPGKPKFDRTCCIHAEWRAILDALRNSALKMTGSSLYFVRVDERGEMIRSGKPYCTVCSRLALDTGIMISSHTLIALYKNAARVEICDAMNSQWRGWG